MFLTINSLINFKTIFGFDFPFGRNGLDSYNK